MYEVKLPHDLSDCPLYWRNFAEDMKDAYYSEKVELELMKYNAKISSSRQCAIEFDSVKDFLFFKTRWS